MDKKRLFKLGASFLYPTRCRFCGKVIDMRETACNECIASLNTIDGKICLLCGFKSDDCVCKNHKHFYKSVVAPFYYEGSAGTAIRQLKFHGRTEIAEDLSRDMAECFKTRYGEYSFDICTFVPSADKEKKKRGFNQAELLCKGVCELINVPYAQLLQKIYETLPQHTLPENERTGNLLGVFKLCDEAHIENARVLLIDDIKTTGSTLNECAKTLMIGGAAEVMCLTAAVAKGKSSSESRIQNSELPKSTKQMKNE